MKAPAKNKAAVAAYAGKEGDLLTWGLRPQTPTAAALSETLRSSSRGEHLWTWVAKAIQQSFRRGLGKARSGEANLGASMESPGYKPGLPSLKRKGGECR